MDEKLTPDFYIDSVDTWIGDWGVTFDMGASFVTKEPALSSPINADSKDKISVRTDRRVTIRMSHSHAKAFSIILARQIAGFEHNYGEIKMLPAVADRLGINASPNPPNTPN